MEQNRDIRRFATAFALKTTQHHDVILDIAIKNSILGGPRDKLHFLVPSGESYEVMSELIETMNFGGLLSIEEGQEDLINELATQLTFTGGKIVFMQELVCYFCFR